jgi:photosystem II Psb27 protein
VSSLLEKMKAATMVKRGDPEIKDTVESARDEMNRFTSYYRRNNKVAGAASFSTLYTAISTLSGHFQNYGPEYPVPAKRQKRLLQQYAEIEKQIARGR